jgi:hypothetical protein
MNNLASVLDSQGWSASNLEEHALWYAPTKADGNGLIHKPHYFWEG